MTIDCTYDTVRLVWRTHSSWLQTSILNQHHHHHIIMYNKKGMEVDFDDLITKSIDPNNPSHSCLQAEHTGSCQLSQSCHSFSSTSRTYQWSRHLNQNKRTWRTHDLVWWKTGRLSRSITICTQSNFHKLKVGILKRMEIGMKMRTRHDK